MYSSLPYQAISVLSTLCKFTSYTLTSKCPMYPWHIQKQDFYMQYGETLWKRNLISFQKIALSQGAFLSILLLTRKANVLKIRWKYNCKSTSLENEKNQAYKQEKKPFKLKVMTRSLWPKIANILDITYIYIYRYER